jgi:hypothetical protein
LARGTACDKNKRTGLAAAGALELAAELGKVEAMLGDFALTEENDGDVHVIERAKRFVGIDVHFAQAGAEFAQQRYHLRFGFFAEMAALASVKRDFDFRRSFHLAFEAHSLCYISQILRSDRSRQSGFGRDLSYNENAGDPVARDWADIEECDEREGRWAVWWCWWRTSSSSRR